MTPSTRLPTQTVRGVPPCLDTWSVWPCRSAGTAPPRPLTYSTMASLAPLRMEVPSGRSTPLMRVLAVNSMNSAPFRLLSSTTTPRSLARATTLLPSGVASLREERAAYLVSSSTLTPLTGMKSAAMRLP